MWCITYVVSVDLLLTDLLHQAVDLILRGDQVVGENLLVQGAWVFDDQSHVATDIAQVGERRWHVSIADNLIVAGGHRIVDAAGEKARVGELVPPTDINDGVGEPELADLVVDNFFLEGEKRYDQPTPKRDTSHDAQKLAIPRHAATSHPRAEPR
jgi:hypothetical protein